MNAKIVSIYITQEPEQPLSPVDKAELQAGRGIVGDRYWFGSGSFSKKLEVKDDSDWEVTLIEAEEIDKFNSATDSHFDYGDFRRNIVTRGIDLNALVGKELSIADVLLQGIRLCEPCAHLARLTDKRVLPALVGRGGLRARILHGGIVSVDDNIDTTIS